MVFEVSPCNGSKVTYQTEKQFVQIKDTCSEFYEITCGVPQGSILGPLLFILYVNDLQKALKQATSYLFADDTSIYYSHSDIKQLEATLNSELQNLDIWMKSNKLSVNISKSNYLIFHPSQKKLSLNLILKYDNQILVQKRHIKFLGVYLDENLSWKIHINYISKKISESVGIIYCSRFLLFIYLALPTRAGSPQQHMPITVGPFCLTHPVNFPCGRKPEYPEETHDFRQSVDFLHNIKQFTILHQGLKIWNCLPSSITGINITSSFKRKLKKYLIENN